MQRLALACTLAILLLLILCTPASAEGEISFAQRVEAQRAIEAVHYSHRLEAKRPFAEAVPAELLDSKVRTYLKQSLLLERRWNTPVTAAGLHAELRRIADNSLLPRRLEEIYAALGNDTRLIEETFARATLVDRLARSFFSTDQEIHAAARAEAQRIHRDLDSGALDARAGHSRRAVHEIRKKAGRKVEPIHERSDAFVISAILEDGDEATRVAVYTIPKVTWESWWKKIEPDLDEGLVQAVAAPGDAPPTPRSIDQSESLTASACHPSGQWINGSLDDLLTPRYGHTAVWTGQLMLVWGGYGGGAVFPPGERYDPLTDTWGPISTVNEPTFHQDHTAIWTGTEMIVWGGDTNTGGRYDPTTDTWAQVSTTGAPSARKGHTAVWSGSRMLIWGGRHNAVALGDGALYDPATNGWSYMQTAQLPSPRSGHTATWTGSLMVVWGGVGGAALNTGGRYDPASDTWSTITTFKAPTARYDHTAVWTGSRVIVWGGDSGSTQWNTGGLYDPVTDNWDPTPTTGAPAARSQHTAVWTGSEMIVWGGWFSDSGGRYDPAAGIWRAVTRVNGPAQRTAYSAVWTGSLMIVWGGEQDAGEYILSTGARYDPTADVWTPVSAPGGQYAHTAVWTGDHMIFWGGLGDNGVPVNSGGRYDPLTDVWAPTSLTGAPAPRYGHTAVWTGSEMIVWGGGGLKSGGRYDPVTDVWAATSLAGAPTARSSHTAVWTGSRMIIWGGSADSTGGRYDPATDTWSPTSLVNAPSPRSRPATAWTGSEMIVWGGTGGNGVPVNSGARYDPVANTWRPTSMVSTPPGRGTVGAVWTGSLMVVWGGSTGLGDPSTGGRYHPDTDTWRPISPSGALGDIGVGVWTGTVLILWGGNSGATYHPYLDTWTPIPAAGAPQFFDQTAVWDGEGMILWGPSYFASSFGDDTGGRYVLAPDTSGDTDADGFTVCAGDCNDADPRVRPGGPQTCDGLNNDCGHPSWPSLTGTNETFDGDGDARSACLDCNDADASAWGPPSATTDLTLTGPEPASLTWAPPASPGATAVRYDVLRSGTRADFGAAAACVESDDVGNTFAVDSVISAAGSVLYYLVRAENGCPGALGVGPLGADSTGQTRSGRTCP